MTFKRVFFDLISESSEFLKENYIKAKLHHEKDKELYIIKKKYIRHIPKRGLVETYIKIVEDPFGFGPRVSKNEINRLSKEELESRLARNLSVEEVKKVLVRYNKYNLKNSFEREVEDVVYKYKKKVR